MKVKQAREPDVDRLGREAFINLFLAANRFTGEVEAICREEELTMSHYTVLWVVCLSEPGDGVSMGVIADGLLTRAADATRLVDRLKTKGYVERAPSETDRRVVRVRPTRSGRVAFRRLTARVKALHRSQWGALSLSELRELRRLLITALWGEDAKRGRHPLETRSPAGA